ncbi:MAG: retention module-containing protein, partial [Desulfocapsaceae bacterium]
MAEQTQIIGKAMIVYGTVKAESTDGVARVLQPNSPIFINDRINTGSDGAVSIVFNDTANTQLDLGRMTDMVIDESILASEELNLEDVTVEVEAIQEALETGEEIVLEETAAGGAAAAGAGGGGFVLTKFAVDGNEGEVTSGAETVGVDYDFTGSEQQLIVEEQIIVPEPVIPEASEPIFFAAEPGTTPPAETTSPPLTTPPPEDDEPTAEAALLAVDEDGLETGNPGSPYGDGSDDLPGELVLAAGNLTYDFGGNGPSLTTPFTWSIGDLPIDLKSAGAGVNYLLSPDGLTVTAYTDDPEDPVFVLSLTDISTGAYSLEVFKQLDQNSVNPPGETIDTEDDIVFNFGYTIQDADGDTASSNLAATVDDDSPMINDDPSQIRAFVEEDGMDALVAPEVGDTNDLDDKSTGAKDAIGDDNTDDQA